MIDARALTALCEQGIRDGVFPGAAFAVGTRDEVVVGACGAQTYEAGATPVTTGTVWDLASVTKVFATTSVAMLLAQDGSLDIDRPVRDYVPRFSLAGVTVRNLLRHDSGLIPHRAFDELSSDRADAWRRILGEPAVYPTGSEAQYSCVGFMVLFQGLTSVLGCDGPPEDPERGGRFEAFLQDRLLTPVGARETCFNPSDAATCAPTEVKNGRLIHGEVHDENARFLGGVSGNAGLFAPIRDVALFGSLLVRSGEGVFDATLFAEWTRRQEPKSTRGLGWDTKGAEGSSAGGRFGPRSFGHLGFTGTSLWVDPDAGMFAALLTNRVHPTRENLKHVEFRPRFHDLAYRLATGSE